MAAVDGSRRCTARRYIVPRAHATGRTTIIAREPRERNLLETRSRRLDDGTPNRISWRGSRGIAADRARFVEIKRDDAISNDRMNLSCPFISSMNEKISFNLDIVRISTFLLHFIAEDVI